MLSMRISVFFVILSQCLNAQLQNDWDATTILQSMDKSWSVGNGCLEANYKVINTSGLELNGYNLEIMDATIQVFGELTNFDVEIDTDHPLITYACPSSELLVYNQTLSNNEPEPSDEIEKFIVKIYPNPANSHLHIKTKSFDYWFIYNMKGQLVSKGTLKKVDVRNLSNGIYFIIIKNNNFTFNSKFIKNGF